MDAYTDVRQPGLTGATSDGPHTIDGKSPCHKERLDALLGKIEPYMADLMGQGTMVKKFPGREDSPYVLQFRQHHTGTEDGRQKRIYIGDEGLAMDVTEAILRLAEAEEVDWPHWNSFRRRVLRERLGGCLGLRRRDKKPSQPCPEHLAGIDQRITEFVSQLREDKARVKLLLGGGKGARI